MADEVLAAAQRTLIRPAFTASMDTECGAVSLSTNHVQSGKVKSALTTLRDLGNLRWHFQLMHSEVGLDGPLQVRNAQDGGRSIP